MFETQGGTRNQTRDLLTKGSAFITSSDHWTMDVRMHPFLFYIAVYASVLHACAYVRMHVCMVMSNLFFFLVYYYYFLW